MPQAGFSLFTGYSRGRTKATTLNNVLFCQKPPLKTGYGAIFEAKIRAIDNLSLRGEHAKSQQASYSGLHLAHHPPLSQKKILVEVRS
jgi:hypothetical protein